MSVADLEEKKWGKYTDKWYWGFGLTAGETIALGGRIICSKIKPTTSAEPQLIFVTWKCQILTFFTKFSHSCYCETSKC